MKMIVSLAVIFNVSLESEISFLHLFSGFDGIARECCYPFVVAS